MNDRLHSTDDTLISRPKFGAGVAPSEPMIQEVLADAARTMIEKHPGERNQDPEHINEWRSHELVNIRHLLNLPSNKIIRAMERSQFCVVGASESIRQSRKFGPFRMIAEERIQLRQTLLDTKHQGDTEQPLYRTELLQDVLLLERFLEWKRAEQQYAASIQPENNSALKHLHDINQEYDRANAALRTRVETLVDWVNHDRPLVERAEPQLLQFPKADRGRA